LARLEKHYQIIGVVKPLAGGDWLMQVKRLSTGEMISYRYAHSLYDPMAN